MKHAIDKAGKFLGYNEVKKLQWKVITEVVSDHYDFFAVLPTEFGLNVKIHNPHISQSCLLYQNEHSLELSEFTIVLYLRMCKNLIKIPPE